MADTKITGFPSTTSAALSDSDVLPVVESGVNKKIAVSELDSRYKADDTAYNSTTWNGDTEVSPSKNAVRDKIVVMDATAVTNTNPDVVSQADAEAGTSTTEKTWTAQRVSQSIAALETGEANPDVISQAEAEAGTATTERIFTAQRVSQAIAALETGEANPDLVSQAEAEAGTATTERTWSAQRVAQSIAALESGGGGGSIQDPVDTATWKVYFEEFMLKNTDDMLGPLGLKGTINGVGSSIVQITNTFDNRVGIYNFRNGGISGAFVSITGNLTVLTGGAELVFETSTKLSATPSGTDDFIHFTGFNSSPNAVSSHHIGFIVDRTISATNYACVSSAGGVQTATDSGVAMDTNYHNFQFIVNASGTEIKYYIDSNLVQTHTTDIPSSAMHVMLVQTWVAGALADTQIDWMRFAFKPTTSRGTLFSLIS